MAEQWAEDVLSFWFGELGPKQWFASSPALDATIRERFGALYERLAANPPDGVNIDPREALAAIILFDQFPRNMHRGTAAAFVTDDLAVRIAREALDRNLDDGLAPEEKQFLYMPFMHSEVSADQEHAVMLFKALGNEEALHYAIEHRDIIERFGRFPHRNRALGRESSHEERAFMEAHKGYGQ